MIPIISPNLIDFKEVEKEFKEIMSNGQITCSKYTKLFEEKIQNTLNNRNVIAVSSCTSGLMLSVKALELTGEVIIPAFTFSATAHSLIWNNIEPVFCDIDIETCNIDVSKIEPLITEKTSGIMAVYTYGLPPEIDELEKLSKKHNIKLIFDSAQGLGSKYKGNNAGEFGDVEVFSLSPSKVITSAEGGIITTNDDKLTVRLKQLRDYGKSLDGDGMDYIGLNARISEFHSIIGLKNFQYMRQSIKIRHDLIDFYKRSLQDIKGVSFQNIPVYCESSGIYIVIFIDAHQTKHSRDEVYKIMSGKGIQTKKYFYPALHHQKAYSKYREKYDGLLPAAEKASMQGLVLPLYNSISKQTIEYVCDALRSIL